MTWLDVATLAWLSASLVVFGVALFPLYTHANTVLAQFILRGSALLALLFGIIAATLHVITFGAAWTQVFATGIGHTWLAQIALAAVLAVAPWRAPGWFATSLAALNLCGFALVGHANAIAGVPGAAIQAVHLLAAGGWIGGLAALAGALRAQPDPSVVRRFSRAGIAFVVLLATTGVAVLFTNTGAALPMRATRYGQLAIVKIVLFGATLLLAAINRLVATPRGAWRVMARVVIGELALLSCVVLAAVALAQTEPYG